MKYLIILFFALFCISCRGTKKITSVKTVADKTATVSSLAVNENSVDSTHTETQGENEAVITEIETSNDPFPANADTTIEAVRILKSLPPGSKLKQTKTKQKTNTVVNAISRDSVSFVQKDSTGTSHEEKQENKTVIKKGNSFAIMLIIVALIGVITAGYFLYKKYIV
jgi:high-affinity Fe2+/Pb2+ permease